MKYKTTIIKTEQVEIDLPETFKSGGYYYKIVGDKHIQVCDTFIGRWGNSTMNLKEVEPITNEEFRAKMLTAISNIVGFEINEFKEDELLESDVHNA